MPEVKVLVGEDRGLARRALKKASVETGVDLDSPDAVWLDGRHATLKDAQEALQHAPWLAPRRLVVLWDFPLTGESGDLSLLERWAQGAPEKGEALLVLWAPEADRRLKVVKALEARKVTQTTALMDARHAEAALADLVREAGGTIDPKAASLVVQMAGRDYDGLDQEAQKLVALTDGKPITPGDVHRATTGRPDLSVFRLTEAVSGKRLGEALSLVGPLLDAGQNAIGLVALLSREFRLLVRTKRLPKDMNAASALGLPPFVASRLVQSAKGWTEDALEGAFRTLLAADLKLKSGFRQDLTLELLLVDLMPQ